ncbi:hypothetical protein ACI3KX_13005 [Microbacterium sp. ZW CA_36]|uniref:hypothetical protein n=1 Tax=Microbacterium sp. ZW CA_36 TaxID=3378078 RepID=UPI003854EF0F
MTEDQTEAPSATTGLSPRAERAIVRTFNSLTNSYATVPEYIAHYFPGSDVWRGDACGCTDDRCTGYHHEGPACGCLDVQLDEFHDDLAVAHRMRDWLAQQQDQAVALSALGELHEWSRDIAGARGLDFRLDATQRAALDGLFASASYLEVDDYARAVNRLGVDVLQQRS